MPIFYAVLDSGILLTTMRDEPCTEQAKALIKSLNAQGVQYELATNYNRPTAYDAQYLAVAERLDCEFWTADERLFNAIKAQFPRIHWLCNFTLD